MARVFLCLGHAFPLVARHPGVFPDSAFSTLYHRPIGGGPVPLSCSLEAPHQLMLAVHGRLSGCCFVLEFLENQLFVILV